MRNGDLNDGVYLYEEWRPEYYGVHCKKKVSGIPVPSRDVTYQILPGQE